MAEKRNRSSVAAALGRGKVHAKPIPTLNEMLEAHCMGSFKEVKVTQNFRKHEQDTELFVCTACGHSVAIAEVQAHPVLHVGICKHCYDFQVSDPFTKDHPQDPFWHENECRWCGDGGSEVILCDSCPKVFCKYCIRRNFGEEILSAIESPPREWSCFVCNDEHMQILNRDYTQTALIGGVLQKLVRDYNDVKNLVNRSGQRQKRRMSRFEGDSASPDEENSNTQSWLPGSPLHHQNEHPSFLKQLTPTNIGHPDYAIGKDSAQFVFPWGFIKTHGKQIQASVKFQGIYEDSPVHVITSRRSSTNMRTVWLLPSEWSRFVKENGLKDGQCLQFSLVADSYFVVRKVLVAR